MDEQSNVNVLRADRAATDRLILPPPIIHGFQCIARIPSKSDPIEIDVVLVDRGPATRDRWATGKISSTTVTPEEWFWGNYYHDLNAALANLLDR